MTEKVLHIVQQFEKPGKKLIAGQEIESRSSAEAIASSTCRLEIREADENAFLRLMAQD